MLPVQPADGKATPGRRLWFWVAGIGGVVLLLVLLAGFLSVAAPQLQINESEPNNTFDQANPISMPGTVYGVLSNQPITETDFFSMTVTPGLNYRATLHIGGSGALFLKIVIYDQNRAYLTSSSSSSTYVEVTWPAYSSLHYIEVQPSGPATTTRLSADYVLDVFQIAATPTPTPAPTATPTPTPAPTPIPSPTPLSGVDRFEPNYDFDHAATIATNLTYENLNFVPWGGATEDNDFFKIWVKPGLRYTCETLDLAPGLDTNIILYDHNRNPLGGNDDVTPGDYRSRISYNSTYEGWLYILVGHGGRFPYSEVQNSTYSFRCTMEVPGLPTPAPTAKPRPTNTPVPKDWTPTPETFVSPPPTATPVSSAELSVRLISTPTPPAPAATPAPHFVPLTVVVYYDANNDRAPGAGEGVIGLRILFFDTLTDERVGEGTTDENGRLETTLSVRGAVRLSIPYLGINRVVGAESASVYIRIPPVSP
ncbi:MAG: hypothetical protein D6793_01480 [Thermoflexia bacterium]|nr:MAG: hypothetical protein D6793_01480 [Thermoflexia bacterium]